MAEPICPKCNSEHTYPDRDLWVCTQCAHEWSANAQTAPDQATDTADPQIRDANGNILSNGDSVIIIKDLKVKGSSSPLKAGTKVRNIHFIENPVDGHNIACKIDGFGAMNLKSTVVKKA